LIETEAVKHFLWQSVSCDKYECMCMCICVFSYMEAILLNLVELQS